MINTNLGGDGNNANQQNGSGIKTTPKFDTNNVFERKLAFFTGSKTNSDKQIDPIIKAFDDNIKSTFDSNTGYELKNIIILERLVFPTLVTVARKDKKAVAVATFFPANNYQATKTVDGYIGELVEITSDNKLKGNSVNILLQDNIINTEVVGIITETIQEALKDEELEVNYCAFHTLAKKDEIDQQAGLEIANMIADELLMAMFVETNYSNDITISGINGIDWTVSLELHNDERRQSDKDVLGHYYGKHLSVMSKGSFYRNTNTLGVTDTNQLVVSSKVHGVYDFRFDKTPDRQDNFGNIVKGKIVAIPEFIITKYETDIPSATSFFLSLCNAVQVLSNKNYAYAAHVNTLGKPNSVTNLNYVLNTEGNENGLGKLPKTKDWTSDDVIKFLNQNLTNTTIISIKVDATNSEAYFNYLMLGAAGVNGGDRNEFNKLLLGYVERLCGGTFDYKGDIFTGTNVKLPSGHFANNHGVNSFDVLNINDFIGSINGQAAEDIIFSLNAMNENPNSAIEINGRIFDSFVCELNAISEAGMKHGQVNGIAYKLTFHPDFIAALVTAINRQGFCPTVSAPAVAAEQVNRTIQGGALGLTTSGSFLQGNTIGGRQFMSGGSVGFRSRFQ